MKKLFITFCLLAAVIVASAQRPRYGKMSSMVRHLCVDGSSMKRAPAVNSAAAKHLCAFVRIDGDGEQVLKVNGCRMLARIGDIFIADIPMNCLTALSLEDRVKRIEAGLGTTALMDSTAINIDAVPVYEGKSLTQAYDGSGVITGIQDVGFDLTHPNFYDSSATSYRIKRLWDQLSADTVGSRLYVGNEYTTETNLKNYAHSRDGLKQTHGTHTLGIAAGSGYDSKYRGIAFGSDICLVSNRVTDDDEFVDSADYYKYTYATDVLGFKYIFDYAESEGKPCVISFSEGSHQDFHGDDQLYYAMLDSLVGPGRIIVSSAGNEGQKKTFFIKPAGKTSSGTFLNNYNNYAYFTLKAADNFVLRTKFYHDGIIDSLDVKTESITAAVDSEYVDTLVVADKQYIFDIVAYPSCYDSSETAYDFYIKTTGNFGLTMPVSVEIVGKEAAVEYYRRAADLVENSLDATLCAGENTRSIYSPASAKSVICVGATAYRRGITNYLGQYMSFDKGTDGIRGDYSSVGPTFDGRTKPDVMAPGTNVISSYSSYYLEQNPTAGDINWDVKHFPFGSRTYAWNSNSGTSMSSPVVAGVIALWLQAKPTLSPTDILDVFSHTCKHYDASLSYPNNYYGYGEIDAYRGLLYILGIDGIDGLSTSQPEKVKMMLTAGQTLEITFDDAKKRDFIVKVFSTSGVSAMKKSFRATSSCTINLSSLPRGVYAVQVNGHDKGTTGSVLIRI
jgi:subtilisin family serine protease